MASSDHLLTEDQANSNLGYLRMKRLIDIFGSIIGLILLSPVFLMVAILIKIEDPKGPIFFKQLRVGKNETQFQMYKFRSMVSNAEEQLKDLLALNEVSGAMFKMKNDPRITKIGKFIRRTSIDELPQLLNVLKGEMSLVGPRPPLRREVDEYSLFDKQRLLVTPGCTGLWQVNGRNSLGFEEMVKLDIFYIDNRNLFFDIKIILKTVKCMINSDEAY
ncbi:sugar transferase [Peribacillus sp. NPDC101481]|uniref:sugar transferase n=1 Tax=Peribacillus sp. NPDC101481 TaxID=3364403 RepID=UPI00382EF172